MVRLTIKFDIRLELTSTGLIHAPVHVIYIPDVIQGSGVSGRHLLSSAVTAQAALTITIYIVVILKVAIQGPMVCCISITGVMFKVIHALDCIYASVNLPVQEDNHQLSSRSSW